MASSSITIEHLFTCLEFRRSEPTPEPIERTLDEPDVPTAMTAIRCPLCKWQPARDSRWTCWDCDYPEYFYNGCGTDWNTFETRGRCPTCDHQWIWTSCLDCGKWSRHEHWYENE